MKAPDIHSLFADVDGGRGACAARPASCDPPQAPRERGAGNGSEPDHAQTTKRANLGDDMLCHVPRLRRYARGLVGNRERADDLVQDTLERALRYASQFRPDSDLRAWLMTIMHNVFINDVMRTAHTRTHLAVDDASLVDDALVVDGHHTVWLEMRDLDSALQQLPAEQREVVLLVGLEDMSYAQVAQSLNVPVGTVMSRLSRARGKLRALLSRHAAPTR
jgi:RNA polymerase sigma-70 factor (ECF subfamily)